MVKMNMCAKNGRLEESEGNCNSLEVCLLAHKLKFHPLPSVLI